MSSTALVLVSTGLLVLASPGSGHSYLVWIALAPLLVVVYRSRPLPALIYSLVAGQLFYFGHLSWFWAIEGITPITFTLAGLANAWLWGLFGFTACLLKRDRVTDMLLFPTLWTLMEYLHHHQGFLSLTWGTLAYTQYRVPEINWIASYAGIYSVTFLIVFVNTCLAYFFHTSSSRTAHKFGGRFSSPIHGVRALLVPSFILVLVFMIGLIRDHQDQGSGDRTFRAALVQAGLPGYSLTSDVEKREALRRLRQLSLEAAQEGPGLIVWPETAVPGRIPYDSILVKILSEVSTKTGVPLLVGAAGYDKFQSSERQKTGIANSAFLFKPGKRLAARYEKIMLVPFNEYLPLRGKVRWPRWIAGGNWKDAQAGSELTVFVLGDHKFGVQICWENLFPDLFRKVTARGVDFMVSITNESFVKAPAAREQMLAFNTFRAIENNVPIIRAASTGISAFISARGDIVRLQDDEGKDLYGAGKLVGNIDISEKRSFYCRFGDWYIVALAAGLCFYFIILLGETLLKSKKQTIGR